jgi:hypothetical protein
VGFRGVRLLGMSDDVVKPDTLELGSLSNHLWESAISNLRTSLDAAYAAEDRLKELLTKTGLLK